MSNRQWIAGTGLFLTAAVAIYMIVRLGAQSSSLTGDYSGATTAEVRDAQGQIVLRGQFAPVDEDDEDIDRKAALQPTGVDADASEEAEVEIDKAARARQEIEFSIRNVQTGMAYTFVIDGQDVATVSADERGRAQAELDVSARR